MTSYNLAYTNSPNGLPNPEDKPKFLKLLEDLFNQIVSNTNDKFTYSIKLITKTNSSNILTDIELINNKINLISFEKNIDYSDALGLYIQLRNTRTGSLFKFFNINLSIQNADFINFVLNKLNEVNLPKKKKGNSSIKKKKKLNLRNWK